MPNAIVDDWDQFKAFLAAQPLCQWSAQKQQEVAAGLHTEQGGPVRTPPKNDNADLAAALSSMA